MRADEPIGANALCVFVLDHAVPFADYSLNAFSIRCRQTRQRRR
jgi:hypothetical protein